MELCDQSYITTDEKVKSTIVVDLDANQCCKLHEHHSSFQNKLIPFKKFLSQHKTNPVQIQAL